MYICYIDESGTPEVPGVSSHFVLAGVSIPIWHWRDADREVSAALDPYGLKDTELHTGWMLHSYREQSHINNFPNLERTARRAAVNRERATYLLSLQSSPQKVKTLRQTKKTYRNTDPYTHLTRSERLHAVRDVADCIGQWGFARLFAECIDKLNFDTSREQRSVGEQAFEQVVTRFERYLENVDPGIPGRRQLSLLVHDNNQTVARKHTDLMKHFHLRGTLYGRLNHIVETPLFVDSGLTRMVQIVDLCSYALRRYLENGETDLFHRILPRADRAGSTVVGIRHYTVPGCQCEICQAHRRPLVMTPPEEDNAS
jgi:hypothetical protein